MHQFNSISAPFSRKSQQTFLPDCTLTVCVSTDVEPTLTLTENEDGWWTARHSALGVTSQDETREGFLENLDEAVQGVQEALDDESAAAPDLVLNVVHWSPSVRRCAYD